MSVTRLLGITLLCGAVCSPASVRAQDEIVERGNVAYQQGDYTSAIEAYEAVLAAGFDSAGLQYNLGNAYFKQGQLGRSILHWERALARSPGDADTRANLTLARSLTVDVIEPMPRFWLFVALEWWVNMLPRVLLLAIVGTAWLAVTGGAVARLLGRAERVARAGTLAMSAGAIALVLFGSTLLIRETGISDREQAVIMAGAVPVRSAPADEDELTLFEVHEGTRVSIEQRTGSWVEVILDDGKVGWIPLDVFEII